MLFRHSPLIRHVAMLATTTLLSLQWGCASPPPARPTMDLHARLFSKPVALVSVPVLTETAADLYARGRLTGALKGAALGPFNVMGSWDPGHCRGDICGAVIIVWAAASVVVGVPLGAVEGAMRATPAEEAEQLDREVLSAIAGSNTHLDLASAILDASGGIRGLQLELVVLSRSSSGENLDYRQLADEGYGAILEVSVTELHFESSAEEGGKLRLQMAAAARIVDPASGSSLYGKEFSQASPYREWKDLKGSDVLNAIDNGIRTLANSMASDIFETIDIPVGHGAWAFPGSHSFGWCWIEPVSPPRDYQFWGARLHTPAVNSLQPTISWRPFPTPEQAESIRIASSRSMDNIRYDMRLLSPRADGIPETVYERTGLTGASHTIDTPLEPGREYYWSVRACFRYEGVGICTPWAFSSVPASGAGDMCQSPVIPASNYYRFRTPY